MARQIILEIKTFSVHHGLKRDALPLKQVGSDVFKLEDKELNNNNLVNALNGFLNNSFTALNTSGEEFMSNQSKTKKYKFNHTLVDTKNSCVYGIFEGGNMGEEGTFNKKVAPKKYSKTRVEVEDFTDSPFYFLIHFPIDSQTGVLMIQKYSDKSLNLEFKDMLRSFFKDMGHNLRYHTFLSENAKRMFAKNSIVEKITVVQKKAGASLADKFLFLQKEKKYKIRIEISEIDSPIAEFVDKVTNIRKPGIDASSLADVIPDLSDLGIDKSSSLVKAHMKEDNNSANVQIKDLGGYLDKIVPKEVIPSNLKIKFENNKYDYKDLHEYVLNMLNKEVLPNL